MTALNAFSRSDGAWMIADTGHYDGAGRIVWFGSKIVASEMLSLAIGTSGRVHVFAHDDIRKWLDRQPDQSTALNRLPSLLTELERADREAADAGGAVGHEAGIRLVLAWWDHSEGRARTALMANVRRLCADADPYSLRLLQTLFSPPLPGDPWPGHSFDPEKDGQTLADLQRTIPMEGGSYRVGGLMEAHRIGPDGISERIVQCWPADRQGRRINPSARTPAEWREIAFLFFCLVLPAAGLVWSAVRAALT